MLAHVQDYNAIRIIKFMISCHTTTPHVQSECCKLLSGIATSRRNVIEYISLKRASYQVKEAGRGYIFSNVAMREPTIIPASATLILVRREVDNSPIKVTTSLLRT